MIDQILESVPTIKYEDFVKRDGEFVWVDKQVTPKLRYDEDTQLIWLSGEDYRWADYWGEFRGNTPWIHDDLIAWAHSHDLEIEWENAGTLTIYIP